MARSSNLKKLALWQGRFRRFSGSGLTVARFCAIEHASESSFYFWQKKLGPQTRRRSARAEDHSTYAVHHGARAEDCGARAAGHDAHAADFGTRAQDRGVGAEDHGVFCPVTVVPAAGGVVIQLPGGTRIEVDAHHLDAIRAVVAEAVRVDHGQAAERNVSSGNEVNRTVSFGNQVMRKRGGTVSC